MIDLDQLAERAVEAYAGPPPSMDRIRALRKRRARRNRAGRTACAAVIVVGIAGGVYAVTRSDSSSTRVVSPAQEQTPQPATSSSRPVLDDCTATSAEEHEARGSSFASPGIVAPEVLADPTRGASGPLVAVIRLPGNGADGIAGTLMPNGDVQGRDANFNVSDGLQGGASWDLANGGRAMVYTRGLTMDELHALVLQVDAGTTAYPRGLQSVGTAGDAHVARSMCTNATGLIAQITEVTGSLASRYSQMIGSTEEAHTFDTDHSSVAIEPFPGRFNADDTKYHQATSEEWTRLVETYSRLGVVPGTTSPPSTPGTSDAATTSQATNP